jgi:glutamine amidotransferase-like uncharacterized protein
MGRQRSRGGAVRGRARDASRVALVYRGPASLPGCPEAVADLLRRSRWGFDVGFVGPQEEHALDPDALAGAVLYAQPGGGELRPAWRRMRRHAETIRSFVLGGGRYLGFCLGTYLAGASPGFDLLPGDVDRYLASPGAGYRTDAAVVLPIVWRGRTRVVYAEDAPYVDLDPTRGPARVLAVYDNGLPAAAVTPYGRGAVGVVGPHPEATADWFVDDGLRTPSTLALDLGLDLIDEVMAG